jgi:hypothetical protein
MFLLISVWYVLLKTPMTHTLTCGRRFDTYMHQNSCECVYCRSPQPLHMPNTYVSLVILRNLCSLNHFILEHQTKTWQHSKRDLCTASWSSRCNFHSVTIDHHQTPSLPMYRNHSAVCQLKRFNYNLAVWSSLCTCSAICFILSTTWIHTVTMTVIPIRVIMMSWHAERLY